MASLRVELKRASQWRWPCGILTRFPILPLLSRAAKNRNGGTWRQCKEPGETRRTVPRGRRPVNRGVPRLDAALRVRKTLSDCPSAV